MLPLLPALILLILRGPSGMEAARVDGVRPYAKEAVCRDIGADRQLKTRHAALVALGKNPAFSRAIAELLQQMPVAELQNLGSVQLFASAQDPFKISLPAPTDLKEALHRSCRTRDGPSYF